MEQPGTGAAAVGVANRTVVEQGPAMTWGGTVPTPAMTGDYSTVTDFARFRG